MSYLSDLLGKAYTEGMTLDDVSSALEGMNLQVGGNANEITKLKNALSKSNSEASEYKKQLRAKQSEEEKLQAEQQEKWSAMQKENAELTRKLSILDNKSKLLGMGYGDELATNTATAMVDGDMASVLSYQAQFIEEKTKNIKTSLMENTPRPDVGASTVKVDYNAKAQECYERGDFSGQAYNLRMAQQQSNTNN